MHIPFYSDDTTSYVKAVEAALERRKLSSWWVMPVSNVSAARELLGLCNLCGATPPEEQWIFVADGGNHGELYGRQLWDRLVVDHTLLYPYTRKGMLDHIFHRMRSLTLDSLLGCDNQLIQLSSDSRVNVSELKGKNVVLYLDYYKRFDRGGTSNYYKLVLELYQTMQKDYPNDLLVFVPLDEHDIPCPPKLPWLVLPHPAALAQGSMLDQLFPSTFRELGIFAFGDDGRVRSMYAICKPDEDDVSDLFADTLHQDICYILKNYSLDY